MTTVSQIKKNNILFIIDPQNDFMDKPGQMGSLAVPGAYDDMKRLAQNINDNPPDDIVVSLDTHNVMDIAHHSWWVNSKGENPNPFTIITLADVEKGKWKTVEPSELDNAIFYLQELEKGGKQCLCIWPDHCIDGTWGHEVTDVLVDALKNWENSTGNSVNYVYKGENPHTEHYSALKAEVMWNDDGYSELRTEFIDGLAQYNIVSIAGEAKSHCVANTVYDLVDRFNQIGAKSKVQILNNCMSSVTGFEQLSEKFDKWIAQQSNMEVVDVVKKESLSLKR